MEVGPTGDLRTGEPLDCTQCAVFGSIYLFSANRLCIAVLRRTKMLFINLDRKLLTTIFTVVVAQILAAVLGFVVKLFSSQG